jgi:hypothetical protein
LRNLSHWQHWIGVDQTGAARAQGRSAAPLPVCWIHAETPEKAQIHLLESGPKSSLLTLESLTPRCLKDLASSLGHPSPGEETLLLLDCVLGLPAALECRDPLWRLFEKASMDRSPAFGRGPAEAFFAELLSEGGGSPEDPIPTRAIEKALGANSVFRSRPYQKNIQTGTYRMWRDLGLGLRDHQGKPWLALWPQDFQEGPPAPELPVALEGYPSFLWKTLFGTSPRAPDRIVSLAETASQEHGIRLEWVSTSQEGVQRRLAQSPDHADALVLALGGLLLAKTGNLFPESLLGRRLIQEGWIAGADPRILKGTPR